MNSRKPPELDRRSLIAAAFAVLEAEGLAGLSMRRVAARLGVQAPAIYWHVEDKAMLLGLMAGEIYAAAYAGVPPVADWRDWLRQFGGALRRSFTARRDGAQLCSIARPAYADPPEQAAIIAAPLETLGLDRRSALLFQAAVISFTLGWRMFEANGPMHAFLDEMMDFEDSFRTGLEAMVAGLPA